MRSLTTLLMPLSTAVMMCFAAPAFAQEERADWLDIELGKSIVLETPRIPTAIAVTDPNIANPVSLGVANQLQIQGMAIGTTDLVVQFGQGIPPMIYEITVHRDMSDLVRRIDSIVEGEPPRVYPLEDRIVVEGEVDDLDTLEQVALVARLYDDQFVNLMAVRGDHQVQLEVMFAEVSRSGLRELGLNALYGDATFGLGFYGPGQNLSTAWTHTATQQYAMQGMVNASGAAGPHLATWITQTPAPLLAMLSILDDQKLGKILAQPTLVSLSGQEANWLAGGQVPIPGAGGMGAVQIQYQPYGISLSFVPTVLANNVIDVQFEVEISEIDPGSGTRLTGVEVPGFLTRRGATHLRVESGMTFAVAGMLADRSTWSRTGIPGLSRLPIIGVLFRAVRHQREEKELVIYVTPRLVRPLAPGEVPAAPGTTENNNPSDFELFLLGMDHRPGSRTASPTGAVGLQR